MILFVVYCLDKIFMYSGNVLHLSVTIRESYGKYLIPFLFYVYRKLSYILHYLQSFLVPFIVVETLKFIIAEDLL